MKMYQLLKSRKQWTRGAAARDKYGHDVEPTSRKAVRWCLFGALLRCYPKAKDQQVPLGKMRDLTNGYILTMLQWNDMPERKFSEVKDLVNKLKI